MRLLLSDADNTLWDTNSVYASAQLRLLEKIENHIGRMIAVEDRLGFVRAVDQQLALKHPMGLRYPPGLLSAAIMDIGLSRKAVASAVDASLLGTGESGVAERFARDLQEYVEGYIPELRPGVQNGMSELRRQSVTVTVLTEGDEARCISLLRHHKIAEYVSSVKSARKTISVYRELATSWNGPAFMVGDQLDVDVQFPKAAGLTTFYFPSDFAPTWISSLKNEATFTVRSYEDVPRLLPDTTSK